MKTIKNVKAFMTGITTLILSVFCILLTPQKGPRFWVACVILLLWSLFSFIHAFFKSPTESEPVILTDERDIFITLKAGKSALSLLHHLLVLSCLCGMILYAFFRSKILLPIIITLFSILLVQSLLVLLTNLYYEKHD